MIMNTDSYTFMAIFHVIRRFQKKYILAPISSHWSCLPLKRKRGLFAKEVIIMIKLDHSLKSN